MNDEGMDKYAVVEDDSTVKAAQDAASAERRCPKCGTELEAEERTNVAKCPKCGTEPFEGGEDVE